MTLRQVETLTWRKAATPNPPNTNAPHRLRGGALALGSYCRAIASSGPNSGTESPRQYIGERHHSKRNCETRIPRTVFVALRDVRNVFWLNN